MTIYQSGQLNTNSLSVPDLYVQILKPQTLALNGVATGRIGLVGTAAWGRWRLRSSSAAWVTA